MSMLSLLWRNWNAEDLICNDDMCKQADGDNLIFCPSSSKNVADVGARSTEHERETA